MKSYKVLVSIGSYEVVVVRVEARNQREAFAKVKHLAQRKVRVSRFKEGVVG